MLTALTQTPSLIASRYVVGPWIGQGGMGAVYRGSDTVTGAPVAIKLLRSDRPECDATALERFRREGETLGRLNHPNIVRVLEVVREAGTDCLVMEYVGGGSLEDLLFAAVSPMPIPRVLTIALDLSDALIRTHRLDIIHRDLKPSNVLIADDGTPRLTDFGVAYVGGKERITAGPAVIGTIDYLSPEAISGEEVDARADIWAFGVLLFEVLTQKRPFAQKDLGRTLHSILFSPPPPLESLRPDCPAALADLVHRLLAKDREQRIPSMRQVAAELDDVLHGRGARRLAEASPGPERRARSAPVRNNLRVETATFVGRQTELLELARQLDDPAVRLLTIVAPGGMGKTRIAIEMVHRLLAKAELDPIEARRITHGVFFVELAPLSSPDFIVFAIGEALGLQFHSGGDPKCQLLEHLREKTLLIVLDNFEHLLNGADIVSDLLAAAPGLTVLATSRERLGLCGESLFPLAGMELPEPAGAEAVNLSAVRLFAQGARRVNPEFRLDSASALEIVGICRLLQGAPLGIVLASSWITALSLSEIAREINAGLDFVAAELRDLPERQRSMRAVFDHSWSLLSPDEQSVLSALSVFRGGFTRDAAQMVTQANVRSLAALINKSLLRRDPETGRYQVHELSREYAEEKLRSSAERHQRVLDLHGEYFSRYLSDRERGLSSPQPGLSMIEIETELDNLRAAWAHLIKRRDLPAVARAMEALNQFHTRRASFAEGEAVFAALLERLEAAPSASSEPSSPEAEVLTLARGQSLRAMFLRQQGRYLQAEQLLTQALARLDEHHHPRERAFALLACGSTQAKLGKLQSGRELAEQGLELYRLTDDAPGLASALETLGRLYATAGDLAQAEAAYRECAQIQRAFGLLESGLMGLGIITAQQGNPSEGCRMMRSALELFENAGDLWNKMRCQMNLANTLRTIGNYPAAEALALDCLKFAQEVGNWDHEAWSHFQLGTILKERGRYEEASAHFSAGKQRSLQAGDAGKIALAALNFGDLALIRGDKEEARQQLLDSLQGFERSGQTWGITLALDSLGYLSCELGEWRLAREQFQRALQTALDLRLYPFATNIVAGIALWLARTGRPEQAMELLSFAEQHPATERHTLARRVAPLRRELTAVLSPEATRAAVLRGQSLRLEKLVESLQG